MADANLVCSGRRSAFFAPATDLYFQIGNEVVDYGDQVAGTVENIRLKTDDDPEPKPYTPTCLYRNHGVSWEAEEGGLYRAAGTFRADLPAVFTGLTPDSPCRIWHKPASSGAS